MRPLGLRPSGEVYSSAGADGTLSPARAAVQTEDNRTELRKKSDQEENLLVAITAEQ
jgi:hypothetical protein